MWRGEGDTGERLAVAWSAASGSGSVINAAMRQAERNGSELWGTREALKKVWGRHPRLTAYAADGTGSGKRAAELVWARPSRETQLGEWSKTRARWCGASSQGRIQCCHGRVEGGDETRRRRLAGFQGSTSLEMGSCVFFFAETLLLACQPSGQWQSRLVSLLAKRPRFQGRAVAGGGYTGLEQQRYLGLKV